MVNRSKVEEWRVEAVLKYSQPHYDRVVYSQADPRKRGVWIMKTTREQTFSHRCDRAVDVAVTRGWCYLNESLGRLRPTPVGEAVIAEKGW